MSIYILGQVYNIMFTLDIFRRNVDVFERDFPQRHLTVSSHHVREIIAKREMKDGRKRATTLQSSLSNNDQ
ncbi:hypothetical protein L6452_39556 [Arctium lappa]|uniref:Uncharacterized protein n=1 Tax=Arctium lappa TaxID=4217 RepID=A0ACB8XT38_ARCLA|nr:hypothetical protein L6452_39556 [Arctium lappa]